MEANLIEKKYGKIFYKEMTMKEIVISCAKNEQDSGVVDWVSGVIAIDLVDISGNKHVDDVLFYKLTGIESELNDISYRVLGASEESGKVFVHVEGSIGESTVREFAEDENVFEIHHTGFMSHGEDCDCNDCNSIGKSFSCDIVLYCNDECNYRFYASTEEKAKEKAEDFAKKNNLILI